MLLEIDFLNRNNLHFIVDKDTNINYRLWRARFLCEAVQTHCASLQLESIFCVDKQIVIFKKQLNIKQYIKNRPTK